MLLIRTSLNLADFDHVMLWVAFYTAWFGFLHVSEFTSPSSGFDPAVHLFRNDMAADTCLHPSAVFLAAMESGFSFSALRPAVFNRFFGVRILIQSLSWIQFYNS